MLRTRRSRWATTVVAAGTAGFTGSVIGPAQVTAQRVVVGDPEDAARALISWFDSNELLVVLRQQPGRLTFEPLSGYRSRFSSDEFGLVVRCAEGDAPRFESMLREAGAQEITREAA